MRAPDAAQGLREVVLHQDLRRQCVATQPQDQRTEYHGKHVVHASSTSQKSRLALSLLQREYGLRFRVPLTLNDPGPLGANIACSRLAFQVDQDPLSGTTRARASRSSGGPPGPRSACRTSRSKGARWAPDLDPQGGVPVPQQPTGAGDIVVLCASGRKLAGACVLEVQSVLNGVPAPVWSEPRTLTHVECEFSTLKARAPPGGGSGKEGVHCRSAPCWHPARHRAAAKPRKRTQ